MSTNNDKIQLHNTNQTVDNQQHVQQNLYYENVDIDNVSEKKDQANQLQPQSLIGNDQQHLQIKYKEKYTSLIDKTNEYTAYQNKSLKREMELQQKSWKDTIKNFFWEDEQNPIYKVFKVRKNARFCIHFCLFLFLILLSIIKIIYSNKISKFTIPIVENPEQLSINMNVANCIIQIEEKINSENSVTFLIYRSTLLARGEERDGENIFENLYDQNSLKYTFNFLSSFRDLKYCMIHVQLSDQLMQRGVKLFNFTCEKDQKCYFVQNSTQFKADQLIFNSAGKKGSINTNFGNLIVNNFSFISESYGSVLLHNVEIGLQANIVLRTGTVAIQSIKEYDLSWKNNAQSLCFTSPFFNDQDKVNWNCDLYDESGTNDKINDCKGHTILCQNANTCTPTTKVYVEVYSGNIYANLLKTVYGEPSSNLFRSKLYKTKVVGFEPQFEKQIDNFINGTIDADTIFKITLGQQHLQASTNTYWVVSNNLGFIILRPWLLAALSFNFLASSVVEMEGFLMPGICPYRTSYTISKYQQMQELLTNKFGVQNKGKLAFINPQSRPPPANVYQDDSGVQPYSEGQQYQENWYEIKYNKDIMHVEEVNYQTNQVLLTTLVLSIICAFLLSLICVLFIRVGIYNFNHYLLETCSHHEKYSQLILNERRRVKNQELRQYLDNDDQQFDEIDQEFEQQALTLQSKISRKIIIPNLSKIFDYYAYLSVKKYFVDSVQSFFDILFRECTEEEIKLMKTGEMESDYYLFIKERELKELYQQYCFLNHYQEEHLNQQKYINLLRDKYGYMFQWDEDHSQQFIKITEKNLKLIPNEKDITKIDSLSLFIHCNYNITSMDTDQEWVDEMRDKYQHFCKKYRVQTQNFRPQQISDELGIRMILKTSQILKRINDQDIFGTLQKLLNAGKLNLINIQWKAATKKKIFFIDRQQIQMHFDLIVNPEYFMEKNLAKLIMQDTKQKENDESYQVLYKTIYSSKWFITDIIIVLLFWIVYTILVIPYFAIPVILNENYSIFSLSHPYQLITSKDLKYGALEFFDYMLSTDSFSYGMIIASIVFICISHVDKMTQYYNQQFPEDKSFLYMQTKLQSRLNQLYYSLQLIWFFLATWILIFYFIIVILWLILGAIINPDKYLVYTSAVGTLITTLIVKVNNMSYIHMQGLERISSIVNEFYLNNTKDIAQHLLNEAQNDQIKQLQINQQDSTLQAEDNLGIQQEVQKFKNKIYLFFKDPSKYLENGLSEREKIDSKDIKMYVNDQKDQFMKQARLILQGKSQQFNIPNKLYAVFDKVLFEKSESIEKLINQILIEAESSQMSEKLIRWIVQIASDKNMKNFSTDDLKQHIVYLKDQLIDSLLDIIIPQVYLTDKQVFALKNHYQNNEQLNQKQQILQQLFQQQNIPTGDQQQSQNNKEEVLNLEKDLNKIKQIQYKLILIIRSYEKNDVSYLLKLIIDIMLLLPKDNSMAQNKNILFVFKCLNILLQLAGGQTNTLLFRQTCLEALEIINIPEKLGMFLSLIFSLNSESNWQYGNLKIVKEQQLWQFIKQFLQELKYSEDVSTLFTFLFSSVIVISKGKNVNYDKFFQIIQKQTNKKIENNVQEFVKDTLNLQQLIVNSGTNVDALNRRMGSNSGVNNDFINELTALGTKNYSNIIISNRMEKLNSSQLISILSKDMRISSDILLGLIALFHCETGQVADKFIDKFITELTDSLGINIQTSKKIFKSFILIANSASPIQVEAILHEIYETQDIRAQLLIDGLKNAFCTSNNSQVKLKNSRQDIKELSQAAADELKQFLNKPFFQLKYKLFQLQEIDAENEFEANKIILNQKIIFSINDFYLDENQRQEIKEKQQKMLANVKKKEGLTLFYSNIKSMVYPLNDELHKQNSASNLIQQQNLLKRRSIKVGQLQDQDEEIGNNQYSSNMNEEQDELLVKQPIEQENQTKSYKQLIEQVSERKPLFMYENLYKELKDIFICLQTGIKQSEEAQFVIDCICNFLQLNFVLKKQQEQTDQESKRDYLIKKVCGALAKALNIPLTSFNHFFNLLIINQRSFDSLYYFISSQKECIFSNPIFQKDDKIVSTSLKQIVEYVDQQETILQSYNYQQLAKYIPDFLIKYKQLFIDIFFRNTHQISTDIIAQFIMEVVDKVRMKSIFVQKQKFLNDFERILYSIVFFKDMEFRDFAKELLEFEDDLVPSGYITDNPQIIKIMDITDHFIKGILFGDVQKICDVVANKLIDNNQKLAAIVLTAMQQRKSLGTELNTISNLEEDNLDAKVSQSDNESPQMKGYIRFLDYFPYLKFYFTNCPSTFSKFALLVLRSKFGFKSLSEEQVVTLFSLFSVKPKFESLSVLLKIRSYYIEIPHLMAQLVFLEKKDRVIQQIQESPNLSLFCQKMKFKMEEFVIILKLFTRCISMEDFDQIFSIFQLKTHFDTIFVKGLYSFVAPENLMKGWKKIGLISIFYNGHELRKQVMLQMYPQLEDQNFAAIDIVCNIKRGMFMNVMIMRDTIPLFREARPFGGKRQIRGIQNLKLEIIDLILKISDLCSSVLGFMKADMKQNNFEYIKINLEGIFRKLDQKKKLINDWISAFYILCRQMNLNEFVFINHIIDENKRISKQKQIIRNKFKAEQDYFPRSITKIKEKTDQEIIIQEYLNKRKESKDDSKSQFSRMNSQSLINSQVNIDEDIKDEQQSLSVIQIFNSFSHQFKYELLEYEFQRNVYQERSFQQNETQQQQSQQGLKFQKAFEQINIHDLDNYPLLDISQQTQQLNSQNAKQYTMKDLYYKLQKYSSDLKMKPNEKKYIIFYLIMYSSLWNLRQFEQDRMEMKINKNNYDTKLKSKLDVSQKKNKLNRFPQQQAYYISKLFLEMDLIFVALDRWGYFNYPDDFMAYQKNLVEKLFCLGLFADYFQKYDIEELIQQKGAQQQQQQQPQQSTKQIAQLLGDIDNQDKIKKQKMLEWNFDQIFPSSLRDLILNYTQKNKIINFQSTIVQQYSKLYKKLSQAITQTEANQQNITQIIQINQNNNINALDLQQTDELLSNTLPQANKQNFLQLIFSHKIEECFTYFEVQEKYFEFEDKQFEKENKKRQKILTEMQGIGKQFLQLSNQRVDQFEKALLKMNSQRPGILGNQNTVQFIKNLLGSALIQSDGEFNYMQQVNSLINYLCTTQMHSDVYNLKLFLKVIISQTSNLDELRELIQIMMKDKLDIFNLIILIFGKSQMNQYSQTKLNKIFSYDEFPVHLLRQKSEEEQQQEQNLKKERVEKRLNQKKSLYSSNLKEQQFVAKLENNSIRHEMRVQYLMESLKSLIKNIVVDQDIIGYIITIILCFCGEAEAWMDLYDRKLKIHCNNPILQQFLYKLLHKFQMKNLPRNLSYRELKGTSLFDVLIQLKEFSMISIFKIVLIQNRSHDQKQVVTDEVNLKKSKKERKLELNKIESNLQTIINVFECFTTGNKELQNKDYSKLAAYLLDQVITVNENEQNQLKQLKKLLKYTLRLSILDYINKNQKNFRHEIYSTIIKFKQLVNMGQNQQQLEQEIKNNVYLLIDLTASFLSGNYECMFSTLLKLDITDNNKLILLSSLWCWCNVKYAIQQDLNKVIEQQIQQFLMIIILIQVENFKENKNQSNNQMLINNDIIDQVQADNSLKTYSSLLEQLRQKMIKFNINSLQSDQEIQQLNDSNQSVNKNILPTNVNKNEIINDLIYLIQDSLKIIETPPERMKCSLLTMESLNWIGKQISFFIDDQMNSLSLSEKAAFQKLLQDLENLIQITDTLGPLKQVLFGYIKFLINCSGIVDKNILNSFIRFYTNPIIENTYPELVSLLKQFVLTVQQTNYQQFTQILDEALIKKLQFKNNANLDDKLQINAQQDSQKNINSQIKDSLEIVMPILFLGYKQILNRKYQDTVLFDNQAKKIIEEFILSLKQYCKQINMDNRLKECFSKLFDLIICIIIGKERDEIIKLKIISGKQAPDILKDSLVIDFVDTYTQYIGFSDSKNQLVQVQQVQYNFSVMEQMLIEIEKCFLNLYLSNDEDNKANSKIVQIISEFLQSSETQLINKASYSNKIIESIIHLVKQNFLQLQEEFFILFKVSSADAYKFMNIMNQFKIQILDAVNFAQDQQKRYFTKSSTFGQKTRIFQIQRKMQKNIYLTNEDLYFLADINNDGCVSLNEFRLILKRLGITLSPHKVIEIFSNIKDPTFISALTTKQSVLELTLNKEEFELALKYVQQLSVDISLQKQSISVELLSFYMIYLIILLLLIFIFIFLGVQAFTIPRSFGSIINSLFPIVGGIGVNRTVSRNISYTKNDDKLKNQVRESMVTVQSNQI